jgi:hypothetical protein
MEMGGIAPPFLLFLSLFSPQLSMHYLYKPMRSMIPVLVAQPAARAEAYYEHIAIVLAQRGAVGPVHVLRRKSHC